MDNYDREYSNSYDWGLDCGRDYPSYDEEIEQMTTREAYYEALRLLRMWLKATDDWWRTADWDTLMVVEDSHHVAVHNAMRTFFTPNPVRK